MSHAMVMHEDFHDGICNCFDDCGGCCMAFWCPCVVIGNNASLVSDRGPASFFDMLCALEGRNLVWFNRRAIRSKYNMDLEGTAVGDCCLTLFCGICLVCQHARELKHRRHHVTHAAPQYATTSTTTTTYQAGYGEAAYGAPPGQPQMTESEQAPLKSTYLDA
eukprot:CAMPEP_0174231912 /NCGR_PEP_ID=MMETSP0417-20130205/2316_1 /TAXON_ID=242541 /ORGANISM="Mayorella sp, Strain BSH-02190019" /LENGTH=162 /DNA_ID=CAMNT_0015309879 /DNA_START=122 /DNA_END=610 /DNA_ORIENTATION=+